MPLVKSMDVAGGHMSCAYSLRHSKQKKLLCYKLQQIAIICDIHMLVFAKYRHQKGCSPLTEHEDVIKPLLGDPAPYSCIAPRICWHWTPLGSVLCATTDVIQISTPRARNIH